MMASELDASRLASCFECGACGENNLHLMKTNLRVAPPPAVSLQHCCSLPLSPLLQGIWWVPEATDAQPAQLGSGAALRAAAAAAGGGGEGGLSGPELLKLAAAMRMNTGGG